MNVKYILLFIASVAAGVGMSIIPEIALICMMLLTVILTILTIKKGYQTGIIALLITVIANYALGLSFYGAVFCFAAAISGLFLGMGFIKGYPLHKLITISTGSFLGSILIAVLCVFVISHKYVISDLLDAYFMDIKNMFQNSDLAYSGMIQSGISIDEFRQSMFGAIDAANQTIRMILPSILVISFGLITYFNFGIIRFILAKKGVSFIHLPTFQYLRMNRKSGWILVIVWILPIFFENDMVKAAFMNISIIIIWLLGFCALSFIDFKLRDKIKLAWLRVIIYIGIFFLSLLFTNNSVGLFDVLTTMLVMLGMADSILDLRSLHVRIKRG